MRIFDSKWLQSLEIQSQRYAIKNGYLSQKLSFPTIFSTSDVKILNHIVWLSFLLQVNGVNKGADDDEMEEASATAEAAK